MEKHTTTVVNIRLNKYDVYIGRAGKGQSGYYGNPYKPLAGDTRGSTIDKFRKYFYDKINKDPEFKYRVETELKNKILGCFCKRSHMEIPCHGDVYVEYFDKLDIEAERELETNKPK